MTDPHDLQRFLDAQAPVYAAAKRELAAGAKRSHWMWFIFPQIEGLGLSPTSRFYALRSLDEARAYFAHPVLGARLRECVQLTMAVNGRDARQIFGAIDALKLRSSLTLFSHAASEEAMFAAALDRFFAGEPDAETLARI